MLRPGQLVKPLKQELYYKTRTVIKNKSFRMSDLSIEKVQSGHFKSLKCHRMEHIHVYLLVHLPLQRTYAIFKIKTTFGTAENWS